jgi:hypothetical protein
MERGVAAATAAGLPGWRWCAGMATLGGGRVSWVDTEPQMDADTLELVHAPGGTPYDGDHRLRTPLPNVDDAATAGCLLAMLGRRVVQLHPARTGWTVRLARTDGDALLHCTEATLGRALVVAAATLGGWPEVAP